MSKVLMTGCTEFIGSHGAEELVIGHHQVIILDDLSGGFKENIPQGAKFICDIINENDLVLRLFKEKQFDSVFQLATAHTKLDIVLSATGGYLWET